MWAEQSSDISDFTSVYFCIYHDCMQRIYLQTRNSRTQSPLGNLYWRTACYKQPVQAGKVLADMPASHILICGSESGLPSLLLFPVICPLGDNGDASLPPTWLIQIEFIVHGFIPRPATAIVVIALCCLSGLSEKINMLLFLKRVFYFHLKFSYHVLLFL